MAIYCSNVVATGVLAASLVVGTCLGIFYTIHPSNLPGVQAYATGGLQVGTASVYENFQVLWRTLLVFNLTVATLFSYTLIFTLVSF